MLRSLMTGATVDLLKPNRTFDTARTNLTFLVLLAENTGAVPVMIDLKPENEFRLTAQEIEDAVTDKTKVIVLPFPNNPTGAIMEKSDLEAVAEVIIKHDLYVISDEIYGEQSKIGRASCRERV